MEPKGEEAESIVSGGSSENRSEPGRLAGINQLRLPGYLLFQNTMGGDSEDEANIAADGIDTCVLSVPGFAKVTFKRTNALGAYDLALSVSEDDEFSSVASQLVMLQGGPGSRKIDVREQLPSRCVVSPGQYLLFIPRSHNTDIVREAFAKACQQAHSLSAFKQAFPEQLRLWLGSNAHSRTALSLLSSLQTFLDTHKAKQKALQRKGGKQFCESCVEHPEKCVTIGVWLRDELKISGKYIEQCNKLQEVLWKLGDAGTRDILRKLDGDLSLLDPVSHIQNALASQIPSLPPMLVWWQPEWYVYDTLAWITAKPSGRGEISSPEFDRAFWRDISAEKLCDLFRELYARNPGSEGLLAKYWRVLLTACANQTPALFKKLSLKQGKASEWQAKGGLFDKDGDFLPVRVFIDAPAALKKR